MIEEIMSAVVREGTMAPEFQAVDQTGTEHSLSQYRGKKVLLFFYPRDMTSGCTAEACDFRDNYQRISARNVVLFGISSDSAESHRKFDEKHNLGYPLLVDADGAISTAYGSMVSKNMFGKKFQGIQRSTFLIDEEGKVEKAWPKVSVKGHVDEVLDVLDA